MYRKLFLNDFRKNPWNNLILLLFMSLSVTLAVSVFLVSAQLVTSISNMYEKANPPHFLQMHKGELVQEEIDSFNKHYPEMKHWQTVQMIDIGLPVAFNNLCRIVNGSPPIQRIGRLY